MCAATPDVPVEAHAGHHAEGTLLSARVCGAPDVRVQGGVLMSKWGSARRVGGAARVALALVAMLVSGCFHAGPSVKQAMTSAAPASAVVAPTAPGGEGTAHAEAFRDHFDLDKPAVERRVADFQTNLRDFFDGALLRGAKYVPTMTDILVRGGVPAELAYLPLIESGYRPHAVSPAGAVGPWQFIRETGRRYGLRIDTLVDERRDPIKSTQAAAEYLRDLHAMFGDWELSLAAYNSGEYRVARILASKDADDFWDMRERGYLPDETSDYVPRFLAAVRIARAPADYGFAAPAHEPYHYETVHVDRQVSLRTAAGMCGVPAAKLAELNPALRRGISPSGYALRVPAGAAAPLRTALANYVEPARPKRTVARGGRGSRNSRMAKAGGRSREVAKARGRGRAVARAPKRAPPPAARVGKAKGPSERTAAVGRGTAKTPSKGAGARTVRKAPAKSPKAARPARAKRRAS